MRELEEPFPLVEADFYLDGDSPDTRLRLLEIVRHADGGELELDLAIASVSDRWSDSIRFLWRRFVSRKYKLALD